MLLFYNLFIHAYYFGVCIASFWNKKAKLWIEGRKAWEKKLSEKITKGDQYIWMHCSSAGELEQGRPVAEALKSVYPQYKLILTFFSPSGYAAAKNYDVPDVISYLPLDTKKNARRFFKLVNPQMAIFIKYEFWYHHLSTAAAHHTPLLLLSAVFRKEQVFFRSYGGFFRNLLRCFQHIFVQDAPSLQLLKEAGISHCSIGGDTRFDRVKKIREKSEPVPFIEEFLQEKRVVVAGSTWADDELLVKGFFFTRPQIKLIIAPHEINEASLRRLQTFFPKAIRYSWLMKRSSGTHESQVLIVDSLGLLSRLYQHATIAYVGGGFTKDGIHNVLEAAVWGKPVGFGPNYKKYREAGELIAAGGGFSVSDGMEFKNIALTLLGDGQRLKNAGESAKAYVEKNTGAAKKIMAFVQEKRLLTKL